MRARHAGRRPRAHRHVGRRDLRVDRHLRRGRERHDPVRQPPRPARRQQQGVRGLGDRQDRTGHAGADNGPHQLRADGLHGARGHADARLQRLLISFLVHPQREAGGEHQHLRNPAQGGHSARAGRPQHARYGGGGAQHQLRRIHESASDPGERPARLRDAQRGDRRRGARGRTHGEPRAGEPDGRGGDDPLARRRDGGRGRDDACARRQPDPQSRRHGGRGRVAGRACHRWNQREGPRRRHRHAREPDARRQRHLRIRLRRKRRVGRHRRVHAWHDCDFAPRRAGRQRLPRARQLRAGDIRHLQRQRGQSLGGEPRRRIRLLVRGGERAADVDDRHGGV